MIKKLGLSGYQAEILTATRERADYYEEAVKSGKKNGISAQEISNIIVNKRVNINQYMPTEFIQLLVKKRTGQITDRKRIAKLVKKILSENQKAVADYKNGKQTALEFLIGCVQREARGKTEPKLTREMLIKCLK